MYYTGPCPWLPPPSCLLLSRSEACRRHEYYPGASGRGHLEVPTCHHVTAGWAIVTTSTAHGKVSGRTPTLRQGGSATAAPLRQSLLLVGDLAWARSNYRFSNPRLDNDALRRDAGRGATTALRPVPLPSPTTVMFYFKSNSQALTNHGSHCAMASGNLAILQAQQRTNASCPTRITAVGLIHVAWYPFPTRQTIHSCSVGRGPDLRNPPSAPNHT